MIRGWLGIAVVVFALLVVVGCGRRGPPLEPFVLIPDAVEQIDARRAGDEVYVTLTVPAQNVDGSLPIAIDHIEIYGYTGATPPPQALWVELGTRVATVPVLGLESAPVPGVPATGPARPEEIVVVRDLLSPEQLVQGLVAEVESVPAGQAADVPPVLLRFYTAFAFDQRGRPSPPGGVAQFLVEDPPPAPATMRATYTETMVTLAWTPSGGLLGYLFERTVPPEAFPPGVRQPPFSRADSDSQLGPTRYNLYLAPDSADLVDQTKPANESWRVQEAIPLNTEPVIEPVFLEPVQFGIERCYVVRTVRDTSALAIESEPSTPLCLTPEDLFPPAAPTGLAAVSTAGRVNLIWELGTEVDLGGYVVLRGEAGDIVLQPLATTSVRETRFLDDNITVGVRYQYAVIALDTREPAPNRSMESARVEATAR